VKKAKIEGKMGRESSIRKNIEEKAKA